MHAAAAGDGPDEQHMYIDVGCGQPEVKLKCTLLGLQRRIAGPVVTGSNPPKRLAWNMAAAGSSHAGSWKERQLMLLVAPKCFSPPPPHRPA